MDRVGEAISTWLREHWILFTAWIGSLTLTQFQQVLGICSTAAVLIYTVVNTYFLIRDKVRR
jgi:hypothetical protein